MFYPHDAIGVYKVSVVRRRTEIAPPFIAWAVYQYSWCNAHSPGHGVYECFALAIRGGLSEQYSFGLVRTVYPYGAAIWAVVHYGMRLGSVNDIDTKRRTIIGCHCIQVRHSVSVYRAGITGCYQQHRLLCLEYRFDIYR